MWEKERERERERERDRERYEERPGFERDRKIGTGERER